jgi:hypothetical protein
MPMPVNFTDCRTMVAQWAIPNKNQNKVIIVDRLKLRTLDVMWEAGHVHMLLQSSRYQNMHDWHLS